MPRPPDPHLHALVACLRAGLEPFAPMPASDTLPISDWTKVVACAHRENVTALLYVALKQSQRLGELPADLAERLHLTYIQASLAHERIQHLVGDLLGKFAEQEIPVVLLKGAALAVTLYPNPAWRRLGDLDLLIRVQDKERVAALLQAHEFTPLLDLTEGFRESLGSEQTYVRRGKQGMSVDVHWQVINVPSYAQAQQVAWFWARTQTIPYGKQTARVFDSTAQLLHLAEHFVLHHQMQGLRWSCDLAWLLARDGTSLDWDALEQAAQQFGVRHTIQAVCAQVEETWGITLPASVRARWVATGMDRLMLTAETAEHPDALLLREGLSYRGWRRKLAYFYHFFFPSPTYMRTRYRIAHPLLVPFYYVWRLGLGARRLIVSSISILGNALRPTRH